MKRIAWMAVTFLLAFSRFSTAGSGSFSTDFDGIGSGSGFTIKFPDRNSSSHGPRDSPSRSRPDSPAEDRTYIKQTYEEQLAEAKKREQEEELRRQIEQKRRQGAVLELQHLLERLQKLESDEPSIIERMRYTQKVIEMEKTFAEARKDYMDTLPTYRDRLAWSLDHIVVPPPEHPRHYQRIMIWGMWDTPEDATRAAQEKGGLEDPFTGEKFDDVFAFGSAGPRELLRVSLDYLLGQLDKLSSATNAHLSALKGATADEVVCHSNGCRVAEVLISTGMLKAKRLRILGGDNVWFELADLKSLQEEKQLQEVSVYITKGDVVPVHDLAWRMMELVKNIGHPLKNFDNMRDDLTYQGIGLTDRPKFDPESPFQVHVMSYPAGSRMNFVQKHLYQNYSRIIKGWRLTECFNSDGTLNQRCMLY